MVSSALAANRAIAIIDWIAGHPGEVFTLSELSRALDINIPSAMSVLRSLTDAGYLTRHPSKKTYGAGPALLGIGLSIGAHNRAFADLQSELEELSEAVGTECAASVLIGTRMMVVADAGRPGSQSIPMRVGYRFPYMAPVGHVFAAWSAPEDVEDWIARSEVKDGMRIDRARIGEELRKVRSKGYSIFNFRNAGGEGSIALEQLAEHRSLEQDLAEVATVMAQFSEDWELLEPLPGQFYDVSNASAPVFNEQGEVVLAVIINGLAHVEGAALLKHVERLLQTTRHLTKQGAGRAPAAG